MSAAETESNAGWKRRPASLRDPSEPPFLWPSWMQEQAAERCDGRLPEPHLVLLGDFKVVVNGQARALSTPVRRLVAFLAVEGGGPTCRQEIAEALWPDRAEASALANLRQALAQERRAKIGVVEPGHSALSLRQPATVDLHEALAAAQQLLNGPSDALVDRAHFLKDLLPAWDEDWLQIERERFLQVRLHCLEELSRRWLARCEWGAAIATAQAAVRGDNLRESAQLLLIQGYLGQENRVQALRQYRAYESELEQVLGLKPSSELRRALGL